MNLRHVLVILTFVTIGGASFQAIVEEGLSGSLERARLPGAGRGSELGSDRAETVLPGDGRAELGPQR